MNTPEIITWIRDQAKRVPEEVHKRGMIEAANKLEALQSELKAEMYRHDRLKAENAAMAAELARLKAENAAMAAELKKAGGCGACKSRKVDYLEEPCFSCMQDPNYPGWEWKGDAHE